MIKSSLETTPWNKKRESADKPGSVVDNHSSGWHVAMHLKQPTREQRGPRIMFPYLVLLRVGFTMPQTVTRCAVRSYRTISPLPTKAGGLFSAALSVGFHPPGVTWHSVLWSPDFPPQIILKLSGAIAWPTPGAILHHSVTRHWCRLKLDTYHIDIFIQILEQANVSCSHEQN